MQRLYGSHDTLLVGYLGGLLEAEGIPCVLRNAFLGGAAGEIPPTECWPEIWVSEDDLPRARSVLTAALVQEPASAGDWTCPECGETVEGQFTACWHCGAERPGAAP